MKRGTPSPTPPSRAVVRAVQTLSGGVWLGATVVARYPKSSAALAAAVVATSPVTVRHVTGVIVAGGVACGLAWIGGGAARVRAASLVDVTKFRKRRRRITSRWVTVMTDAGLVKSATNGGTAKRKPKILRVRRTPLGVAVTANTGRVSVGAGVLRGKADVLRHGFGCRDIRATDVKPGTVRLDLRYEDPFRQVIRFAELPAASQPLHAVIGFDEDRMPVEKDLRLPNLIVGAQGAGKALALDTPIPTPDGWRRMGDLRRGDRVFDEDGQVCTVTAAYPVLHDRPCYEVEFSDGEVIVADAEHQWITETLASRQQSQKGHRGRPPYSNEQLAHAQARVAAVLAEPDRLVTLPQLAADIGLNPTSGILRRVARQIGSAGKVLLPAVTPLGQPCHRPWPGHPRQLIYKAILDAMSTPKNSHRIVDHGSPVTTAEIADSLRARDGAANHAIPVAGPLDYPDARLPVPPYVLGAWLGDGTSAAAVITTADVEIVEHLRAEGLIVNHRGRYSYALSLPRVEDERRDRCGCGNWALPGLDRCGACGPKNAAVCVNCGARCRGVRCRSCPTGTLTGVLRSMGVLPTKHIPRMYMQASMRQRRDLLAGLLDTDGTCTKWGSVEFTNTNEDLARAVLELAIGLGYKATLRSKPARLNGRDCGTAWTVAFTAHEPVFRLARKRERQRLCGAESTARRRYITAVRRVPSVPVRCIQVASPNHLYLAGRACIATHNSSEVWTLLAAVQAAGIPHRVRVFDPKGGQEFADLEDAAYYYERDPTRWGLFLQRAHRALAARQEALRAAQLRVNQFSDEHPLDLMLIDELLTALAMSTSGAKVKVGGRALPADKAFLVYLSNARSAGFTVVACSQLGQKASVGEIRDLFPYTTCLRVASDDIVNIILGPGAAKAYPAHELRPNRSTAGIGWMSTERGVVKYRAAHLADLERGQVRRRMRADSARFRRHAEVELGEAA